MKLAFNIIWRETPSRIAAKEYIEKLYRDNFPEADFFFTDSGFIPFEAGSSRNIGVELAKDYDVLVVADADVIVDINSMKECIELANDSEYIYTPFSRTVYISLEDTPRVIDGSVSIEDAVKYVSGSNCSGMLIAKPTVFKSLYGWDEKFIGWGYEDTALHYTHQVFLGSDYKRVGGDIFFLNHDYDSGYRNQKQIAKNEGRLKKYYRHTTKERLVRGVLNRHG